MIINHESLLYWIFRPILGDWGNWWSLNRYIESHRLWKDQVNTLRSIREWHREWMNIHPIEKLKAVTGCSVSILLIYECRIHSSLSLPYAQCSSSSLSGNMQRWALRSVIMWHWVRYKRSILYSVISGFMIGIFSIMRFLNPFLFRWEWHSGHSLRSRWILIPVQSWSNPEVTFVT